MKHIASYYQVQGLRYDEGVTLSDRLVPSEGNREKTAAFKVRVGHGQKLIS
jgi:hypothetical protein